jgi:hypothetical protein
MPKFMDFHENLKLPQEAIDQIAQGTRDGATDEFGVQQVELYHNPDGKVYCLLEGPDEDAIRKHHEALDVLRRRASCRRPALTVRPVSFAAP